MKRCMYAVVFLFMMLAVQNLYAQQETHIRGTILDSVTLTPVPFASVRIMQNGIILGGGQADIDGNYIISGVPAGVYKIITHCINYKRTETTVSISNGNSVANLIMAPEITQMQEVVIELIRANTYRRCCFCGTGREIIEYYYTDPAKDSIVPVKQQAPERWYNMQIYPNPTASRVNISASLATVEPVQLQIFDAAGKLILQQQMDFRNRADYSFDLSAQRHGTYFFHMQYMGETRVEKVMKLQ